MRNLKKVGENNKAIFYADDFTRSLTEYARKEDLKGVSLEGWSCLLVVERDSLKKIYLLLDDKNNIVGEHDTFEGVACKIDIYKLLKRDKEFT